MFTYATNACTKQKFELCYVGFQYFQERFPDIVEGDAMWLLGRCVLSCRAAARLSRPKSQGQEAGTSVPSSLTPSLCRYPVTIPLTRSFPPHPGQL